MQRPSGIGAFQFVILASLRAAQLMRGCLPRIDGPYKKTTIAQLEVAQGKVMQFDGDADVFVDAAALAMVGGEPVPPAIDAA